MLLSDYRQARGLSTAQVAERVGISRSAAAQLDRGDGAWRALTFEQLTSLAATYGVDLGDLVHRLTSRRPGQPFASNDATKLEAALSHAGQVYAATTSPSPSAGLWSAPKPNSARWPTNCAPAVRHWPDPVPKPTG